MDRLDKKDQYRLNSQFECESFVTFNSQQETTRLLEFFRTFFITFFGITVVFFILCDDLKLKKEKKTSNCSSDATTAMISFQIFVGHHGL
ncbi:hypothetical protein B9Z55_024646 [Caenorhabditis nigoni]|uniref:Uncharacterized protein n=1 Tax=Caenorhabditis nigoni TaxID=1611254 RepID=A0A2G5SVM6_9PELO|nr:hypothetical protein B9Z55_024646 [Caenorhabditis nigoni]